MRNEQIRRLIDQKLLNPYLYPYALLLPVPAWAYTLFSVWMGGVCLLCLISHQPVFAVFALLLSALFDCIDGTVARAKQQVHPFGTLLDFICDRIVEFLVLYGLFLVDPQNRAQGTILMLGSLILCYISFLGVAIYTPNQSHKGMHYSEGLIERTEAFVCFIVMILVPSTFGALSLVFASTVTLTALWRVWEFYQYTHRQM